LALRSAIRSYEGRQPALEKGGLRRETPGLLALDDGSLVEGVVDLAFHDDMPDFAGWTVVDFKTGREFAVSSARLHCAGEGLFRSHRSGNRLADAGHPAGALIRQNHTVPAN
jgi:hypothetical protein